MPLAILLPMCASGAPVDAESLNEAVEWALSGVRELVRGGKSANLILLAPGEIPTRIRAGGLGGSNLPIRLVFANLDGSSLGNHPCGSGEAAFSACVSILSSVEADTVIFLLPWGELDSLTSSALLGALAHSLASGRRLTLVARRGRRLSNRSGVADLPPERVLEVARVAESLSRVVVEPHRESLWVELFETSRSLEPCSVAELVREAALLSLGVSLGTPIVVHLHLSRLLSRVGEEVARSASHTSAIDAVPILLREFALRAAEALGVGPWTRPGELPSELIAGLLRAYRRSGMALQYHLLLSEVSGTVEDPGSGSSSGSTLSSFLLERRAAECRVGELPAGAPLFRLWFLAGGTLDFLRSERDPERLREELGAWLERLMAARHDSRAARLLEEALSARYTREHVRNFLAHSGLVHYVVRDVAPRGDGGYLVLYDEAAVEGIEEVLIRDLLGAAVEVEGAAVSVG